MDFATHAHSIESALSDLTQDLLRAIHLQTHEEAKRLAVEKTPRRTGRTAAQWMSVPNAQPASAHLQPSKVRNASPAASILSGGRRRTTKAFRVHRGSTSYIVGPGKMIGSEQAPMGIKGPVLRELAAREDAIFDAASAAVNARHGGAI